MTIAELFRTTLRSGPDYGLVLYHVHVMRPVPEAVDDLLEAGWIELDSPSTVVEADCVATFVTADESVAFATLPADDWATTRIFDVWPVIGGEDARSHVTIAQLFRTTLRGGPNDGLVVYHFYVRQSEPEAVDDLVEAGWTPLNSLSTVVDADWVARFATPDESVAFSSVPADYWATTRIFDAMAVIEGEDSRDG